MKSLTVSFLLFALVSILLVALPIFQEESLSLKHLTPENYHYVQAEGCANCKGAENVFMPRAAGVDLSGEKTILDDRGWLNSIHARSQSHEDRVDTACAYCHAPTTPNATRNKDEAQSILKGTWQGVSCFACHPGPVERDKRQSLLVNFLPGTEPSNPDNYIFRNRSDGTELNAQCRFCHHESHDLLIEKKQDMMDSGEFRCVDCHMAAFAITDGHVERFHNFKVEKNLPYSCSGSMGRAMNCHDGKPGTWFQDNLSKVKGPRKEWEADWSHFLSNRLNAGSF
ncbi:hypothetical protein ACFLT9_00805 [Acidobacteriota bacterium]